MQLAEFKTQIGEIIGVESKDLSPDTDPTRAAGWDSMASVEIIAMLEEVIDGSISAEEADGFDSFGAILSFACNRGLITD